MQLVVTYRAIIMKSSPQPSSPHGTPPSLFTIRLSYPFRLVHVGWLGYISGSIGWLRSIPSTQRAKMMVTGLTTKPGLQSHCGFLRCII